MSALGEIKGWFVQRFESGLVWFWAKRRGDRPVGDDGIVIGEEGGPPPAIQPTDNVMRTMNLIMPLADATPVGKAKAAMAVASCLDEIYSGLDNVGTVHFARFDIIGNDLCMISVYDGDFETYIRDFIVTLGHAFNAVVSVVANPPPKPCELNTEEFIQWVHRHDAYQLPDDLAALAGGIDDIRDLPREVIMKFHDHPYVQLGSYRGYPGHSVAQVRDRLGVGW